jgi:hypothetical protein
MKNTRTARLSPVDFCQLFIPQLMKKGWHAKTRRQNAEIRLRQPKGTRYNFSLLTAIHQEKTGRYVSPQNVEETFVILPATHKDLERISDAAEARFNCPRSTQRLRKLIKKLLQVEQTA